MILSDKDIIKARERGDISIFPFSERFVQPASYDLHLGKEFAVFKKFSHDIAFDVKEDIEPYMERITIDQGPFILGSGQFALAVVAEQTGVSPEYVGRLEGKSSLGRLGVFIHITAGFLDPGNNLNMTLELFNATPIPIKLYPGMPIAQMAFEKISDRSDNPYSEGSKYYSDRELKVSKMHLNWPDNYITI